jgi:hypothetical protein
MPRALLVAAALAASVGGPVHAQDAFDLREMRGSSTMVGASIYRGDWLPGYVWSSAPFKAETFAVEAEYRGLGMRAGGGRTVLNERSSATLLVAADYALRVPRSPLVLVAGASYQQAELAEGRLAIFSAPVYVANNAAIDFGGLWVHPILALGAHLHKSGVDDPESGIRKYAMSGVEVGVGGISVRGRLQHHVTAQQMLDVALRVRLGQPGRGPRVSSAGS